MACWLVRIVATHPHLVGAWCFYRRVCAATAMDAERLACLVLDPAGWRGQVVALGLVSAASPGGAAWLDRTTDGQPPMPGTWNALQATWQPHQATNGRQAIPPARLAPERGTSSLPRGRVRVRQVHRGKVHVSALDELRSNPLAWPVCGWLVDRTSATLRGQAEPPHHDPRPRPSGVSDALTFGPDLLATDRDADHDWDDWWRQWA